MVSAGPWLVRRPADEATVASLLAASDVLGTGWFGAVAAEAGPGETVAVVGDGAVGLMAVLAASWEPTGSSPCPGTRTALRWHGNSEPPTWWPSAARKAWPRSRI